MTPEKLEEYYSKLESVRKEEQALSDRVQQIYKEMYDDGVYCSRCAKLVRIENGVPHFCHSGIPNPDVFPICFVEKEKELMQ